MTEVGKRVKEFSQMVFVLSFPTFLYSPVLPAVPALAVLIHLMVQSAKNTRKSMGGNFSSVSQKHVFPINSEFEM